MTAGMTSRRRWCAFWLVVAMSGGLAGCSENGGESPMARNDASNSGAGGGARTTVSTFLLLTE